MQLLACAVEAGRLAVEGRVEHAEVGEGEALDGGDVAVGGRGDLAVERRQALKVKRGQAGGGAGA